jgi:uncharacterized membrane protein YgcG
MATKPILSPSQQVQQFLLRQKLQALDRVVPPEPLRAAPMGFIRVTTPYVAYPAPGAAAVTLLSYTVPPGLNAMLTYMAIFNVGAAFVNGSGNVIWRVLINQAGVKGFENLQSQFGTDGLPLPVAIPLIENDTIQVTVEIPGGQGALAFPANSTGVRFHGSAAHAPIAALAGIGTSSSGSSSSSSSGSPAGGGAGGGGGVTPPFSGGGYGGGGGRPAGNQP